MDEADTKNINTVPATPEVLAWQNRFETMCTPATITMVKVMAVVQKAANPPNLMRPEWQLRYTDGKFFHVMSAGQNIMSHTPINSQNLTVWCIVHYIRVMQRWNRSCGFTIHLNLINKQLPKLVQQNCIRSINRLESETSNQ